MDSLLVSDAACADCKGPVTLFAIPDKAWTALGLSREWICLSCICLRLAVSLGDSEIIEAHRADMTAGLDMEEMTETIRALLYIQRKKFKLKSINKYCGAKVAAITVILSTPGEDLGRSSLTVNEVMRK